MDTILKNQCGTCTMCCKLIAVTELDKKSGENCRHCTPGWGCRAYENRPESCRTASCLWLHNNWPQDLKPDKLKAVFMGAPGNEIQIFTEYPHGQWQDRANWVLQELHRRGFKLTVVHVKPA